MPNKPHDSVIAQRPWTYRATVYAIRKLGLMPVAEWLRYRGRLVQFRKSNRLYREQHPDFATPPPHLAYDAYGTVNWPLYYQNGVAVSKQLGEILQRHGKVDLEAFLEWGCGPGCVIRHMPGILGPGCRVYGSDYNHETIAWCREALPGITFSANGVAPPLPFEDGMFDALCGLSVLTHLSEDVCRQWLVELARVLKVNGIAILTSKGLSHAPRLLDHEVERLKRGESIVRGQIEEGKRLYDTMLPEQWMHANMPANFEVAEFVPEGMKKYGQDLWVLRKVS